MKYEIVPINTLKPLEKVFPNHLKNLKKMIIKDKIINQPIIVDRNTGIILDGSHRYIFFLMDGYKTVPVRFVDYKDENIRVGTHLMHRHIIKGITNISKDEVKKRGLTGNLYPPRTTRHFFPFRKEDIELSLSKLNKGEPINVDEYKSDVGIDDEINHNKSYINEIESEIDEIIKYLSEVIRTKDYLKQQLNKMKKGLPKD